MSDGQASQTVGQGAGDRERDWPWDSFEVVVALVVMLVAGGIHWAQLHYGFTELFEWIWIPVAAVLGLVISLYHRYKLVPRKFRLWRPLLGPAVKEAARAEIVQIRLDEIVDETRRELDGLISGRFTLGSGARIPELSNKALESVWNRVLLVMPNLTESSLRFYLDQDGRAYFRKLVEIASTIKRRHEKFQTSRMGSQLKWGATRLFYIGSDDEELTIRAKDFIEQHKGTDIEVRCFEKWPPRIDNSLHHDFGYFETRSSAFVIYVEPSKDGITATPTVETRPKIVSLYRAFAEELCGVEFSREWKDYWPTKCGVMNTGWDDYYSQQPRALEPPHGMSDEDADYLVGECRRLMELGCDTLQSAHVLVLGCTIPLIQAFQSAGAKVTCLDQAKTRPILPAGTEVFSGNWLEYRFGDARKFDVVACDEAINNLRPVTYSTFFSQVTTWLRPSGCFVGRLMGRDPGSDRVKHYSNLEFGAATRILREVGAQNGLTTATDFACELIPVLHCRISYNAESEMIDTAIWNSAVSADSALTSKERALWRFPMALKLSSPDFDGVRRRMREAGIEEVHFCSVQGSYCRKYEGCALGEFYRLFSGKVPA